MIDEEQKNKTMDYNFMRKKWDVHRKERETKGNDTIIQTILYYPNYRNSQSLFLDK